MVRALVGGGVRPRLDDTHRRRRRASGRGLHLLRSILSQFIEILIDVLICKFLDSSGVLLLRDELIRARARKADIPRIVRNAQEINKRSRKAPQSEDKLGRAAMTSKKVT